MKILAIDAACTACSACVSIDGKIISSEYIANGLTHSVNLLPSVQKVLSLAAVTVAELDLIATTVGPGSFTGVKIAVSTAKGLAFANNTNCFAVSSLEALALNFINSDGLISPVFDARRGMLYNALFKVENGSLIRLTPDRQISATELSAELEGKNPLIAGDGSVILSSALDGLSTPFRISAPKDMLINAESVAFAAENGYGESLSGSALASVYLRPPQAERERLEKLAK